MARVASSDTEILIHGRRTSFGADLDTLDVIGSPIIYHSVVAPAFVCALIEAEREGADAFVIASFSEPILAELRSFSTIPVVSMPEACFAAAASSGLKIGFVTLNKLVVPFIEKSIAYHKWMDRVSGIHLIDGDVSESELDRNFPNPRPYIDRLLSAARGAIAGGAHIVIPAEGVLGVMAASNGLRSVDGVPIVDAIGSTILFAEMSVLLRQRTGLSYSAVSFTPPSVEARGLISKAHSQLHSMPQQSNT